MNQSNTLLNALMFQQQVIPQINLNADYVHQGFFKREESEREKNPDAPFKKQMIEKLINEGLSNQEIIQKLGVHRNYVRVLRFKLKGPSIKRMDIKQVVQLTIDGEYIATHDNQVKAALSIGKTSTTGIGRACNGSFGRKTANGYCWMFLEDYEKSKVCK